MAVVLTADYRYCAKAFDAGQIDLLGNAPRGSSDDRRDGRAVAPGNSPEDVAAPGAVDYFV